MGKVVRTQFHIVRRSPWPFMLATVVFWSVFNFVWGVYNYTLVPSAASLVASVWVLAGWFGDIITEATFMGKHTRVVQKSLKLGFWCFLASEGMFFFSFFWAYLFNAINPYDCFGGWPPKGIEVIDCLGIPILNTAILIVSGLVVTWAMAAVKQGIFWEAEQALALSIGLGMVFEVLQGYEYWICSFTLTDGVFGSCFYTLTGLHGLHVMGGILFLCVGLGRLFFKHFSPNRHLGLDFAVWYWHFVDVVWVFLYLLLYVHPHFMSWMNS